MIKVLLLDVDGVLAIGEPFSAHLARDHGITREITASFFKERFAACLVGKADLRQELARCLPGWGWQQSADDFLRYWFTCEHIINDQLISAVQLMRQQGIRCYLATNQEQYRAIYIWRRMGFEKKFDGIFSSAQIGSMKPDPAFFQHIVQTLQTVEPQDMLFWDDRAEHVESAKNVGLQAELYTDFASFVQKTALHIMPAPINKE